MVNRKQEPLIVDPIGVRELTAEVRVLKVENQKIGGRVEEWDAQSQAWRGLGIDYWY